MASTAPRVALITGASAGIGYACAERLSSNGWTVVGGSRRGTSGNGWSGIVMDVDDDSSVDAGVSEVIERHDRIDAVVAAAGWGLAGAVERTPIDEAKRQLETNFWGTVRVVKRVLPTMRAQQHGRLVLMSSIGGVIALPFQGYYSASKFALEGLAEALAYEVAPYGIDVTLVQAGNIATDFTTNRRVIATADDDPYRPATDRAIAVMARDESNGPRAAVVAVAVHKVLASRRPPRRVSVGRTGERVGVLAKRLLPFRVFQSAAKSSLGVE